MRLATLIPTALTALLPWTASAQQPPELTQFRDWTLACEPADRSQCMIRQVLINSQTQAPIMTVMIGYSRNIKANPVIVFNLPASIRSQELLTLKVDTSDQKGIPGIRCNGQVCSAIANFTPDLAAEFQKGSRVAVTFPDQTQRVGLTVSLGGFSAAYKALLVRHAH